jgi:hypothetical protein
MHASILSKGAEPIDFDSYDALPIDSINPNVFF